MAQKGNQVKKQLPNSPQIYSKTNWGGRGVW